ncbi:MULTISPECIES: alpha-amylase family glycosyl hydrolase [unclassified Lactococcus]|uniref:alpha-amylase family glycosyl hydrolase n=1 Tax=unclassified Lactococcus TaxID=2643510 RepID=UPI001E65574E|nr:MULTISPECIES: alpha-amylase family glycosyl hydrolase [unclassified Lactococcus]
MKKMEKKKNKRIILAVFSLLALSALTACNVNKTTHVSIEKTQTVSPELYRNFYEIFTGSFADSNHDGEGDLNGVTDHLDYLNTGNKNSTTDLKVNGLWMTPIFASPSYHGYDVTNYEEINPKMGTMADFERLIKEAKKRGIAVILDLPFNDTSSQHPWFKKALAGVKKYMAYYNWSDTAKQGYTLASNGKYYESEFDKDMPDLNLANPDVKKELAAITKFWLDKGVSGFRLDAVYYYFQNDDEKTTAFTKWLVQTIKSQDENAYVVGEVFSSSMDIAPIYASKIDSLFNFPMALNMNSSTLNGAVMYGQGNLFEQQVTDWDSEIHKDNPTAIDAPFLSNHDTDRSSQYFQTLASQKMAASAYLLLPGNPFIYYGEELGMTGNGIDQNKRLPMQWNTTGQDSPAAPVGSTETVSTDGGSVATQESNPQSLLNWYKKILRLKAKYPQIASSRISAVDESNTDLSVVNYGKDLTIINNFSSNQTATFKIPKGTVGKKLADSLVVSGAKVSLSNDELVMPAYSTVILKK